MAELPSERAILDALRQRYEAEGYSFIEYPSGEFLPPFVKGHDLDAVAIKDGVRIAIEVKPRRGSISVERSKAMAAVFQNQPGWNYVVIYAEDVQGEAPAYANTLDGVQSLIAESEALLSKNFSRAALLVAWSAIEAAFRAKVSSDPIKALTPARIVDHLVQAGAIDEAAAKSLNAAAKRRNDVAHGYARNEISAEEVRGVIRAARSILAGPSVAVPA